MKKEDLYRELLDRSRINERLVTESDFEKENLDEDYKTATYIEWLEKAAFTN